MAVVKADAYGCGAKEVAPVLEQAGIDFLRWLRLMKVFDCGKMLSKAPSWSWDIPLQNA